MRTQQVNSPAPTAKRAWLSFEIKLPSSEAKDSFITKLESLRAVLKLPGVKALDNYGLFCSIFDALEGHGILTSSNERGPPDTTNTTCTAEKSMLQSSGKKLIIISNS